MAGRAVVLRMVSMVALTLGPATAGGTASAGSDETPVRPPCVEPAERIEVATAEEARARLVGTWIRCGDAPRKFVAFDGDDVGFEFTDDGRFFRLYVADDGSLIRAEGLFQEGTWRIDAVDDSGEPELGRTAMLQQHLIGSGYFSDGLTFHDDPDAVGIVNAGFHYHRWSGAAPSPGESPGVAVGPCGRPVDPVTFDSSEAVVDHLLGPWTLCGDAAGAPFGEGAAGIEFRPDGTLAVLSRAADGDIVAGAPTRTWTIREYTGALEWGNAPQLDVAGADGTRIFLLEFLASPTYVHLDHMGVEILGAVRGAPAADLPPTGGTRTLPIAVVAGGLIVAGLVLAGSARRRAGV